MPEWNAAIDQEVGVFLATSRTLALATVDEHSQPHACNVQYAIDDSLRMIWVSSPRSEHSHHIERDGRVAATVYGHDDRAHNIHGLQIRGTAERLTDAGECNAAWELYTTRFAFVAALPQFRELLQKHAFYRMTPTWARWIDNRKGFGWKLERDLTADPMPLRAEE